MEKEILQSKFGPVEIDPNTVITFPKGILGFPRLTKYVILDPEDSSPLKFLQSYENPGLAFVIVNPLQFKPDYKARIYQADMDDIKTPAEEIAEVLIFVIVTVPADPTQMTANLKGPLLIGKNSRLGKQVILDSKEYELKFPLLAALQQMQLPPAE